MMVQFMSKYNCHLRSWFSFICCQYLRHDESIRSIVYLICVVDKLVSLDKRMPYQALVSLKSGILVSTFFLVILNF